MTNNKNTFLSRWYWWLPPIVGMMVLFVMTFKGIGIWHDSVLYLETSTNLIEQKGFGVFNPNGSIEPIVHFPPFFSIILMLLQKVFRLEAVTAASMLNIILFGFNIFFTIYLTKRLTRSKIISVSAGFFVIFSPALLTVHSYALSEGLFIFLILGGILLIDSFFKYRQLGYLFAAGVFVGMSIITRYVGLALFISISIVLLNSKEFLTRYRIKGFLTFAALSLGPIFLWFFRNSYIRNTNTIREIGWHPVPWEQLKHGLGTMISWYNPQLYLILTLLILTAIVICIWYLRHSNNTSQHITKSHLLFILLTTFIAVYLGAVIVSISLLDAYILLYNRILSPLFIPSLISISYLLSLLYRRSSDYSGYFNIGINLLAVVLIIFNTYAGIRLVVKGYNEGIDGYQKSIYKDSKLIDVIKDLDPSTVIYSNAPDVIKHLTGRSTYQIPAKENQHNLKTLNYDNSLMLMKARIKETHGRLIIFNEIDFRYYLVSTEEMNEKLELSVLQIFPDGAVYTIN